MDRVDMAVSGTPEPASGSPQDGRADLERGALGFALGLSAAATAVLAAWRTFRRRERRKSALVARPAGLERRGRDRTAELHAANRAVAESETRLRAIFDSTFQLTGLATIDGVAVAANRPALQAAQVTEHDVIGKGPA